MKDQPTSRLEKLSPATAVVQALGFVAHGTVAVGPSGTRVPADLHDDGTITRMTAGSEWVDAHPSEYATFIKQP